ncbi:MAG: AAA-like domain-containing protein [Leptolyngbyaceae cyanobacterium MO_188.B28]|nr:AAA-like domain-containing protein [Leptolyngbyaceae cyanobacterium MO_188.B28]
MTVTKILVLAANPSDTTRLRLPEEVREIREGLALSDGRELLKVISQWAVRPKDLRRAMLKYKPRIVHFSGHGAGEQGLVFESDAGNSKFIDASALSRLFKLCPSVQCVLLNACYSEVQAEAIAQHIDFVIGMNSSIGDRAAIKFAVGFYDGLGYGRSIKEAFEFGLLSIDFEGIPESAIPVLKLREQKTNTQPESLTFQAEAQSQPIISALAGEEPEGLVPIDSSFYIERSPVESDCYDTVISPGSLIRIKAPRQMGKTSLLVRILHYAKQQKYETVRLNLQTVETKALSDVNEFLQWFCASVTEELNLLDKMSDYWMGARGIVRRCQRYFERYLLEAIPVPIVLGLDEVDQVFEHAEIATDFFGMLRDWHEVGKTTPVWRKLRLVIVHSKEVYVPLSINHSPFNVGLPVELREFNQAEIEALIQRYHLNLAVQQKQQLINLVGGHPYLLRVALYQLARGRITLPRLLDEAPTESGLYNDHLRRHLLNLEAESDLVRAFQQVISANQPIEIGSTEAFKLSSMGLVKYQRNQVFPLCDLYRQYFQNRLGQKS